MSEWQPIETAPKDVPILAYFTGFGGRVEVARWQMDQYAKKPRPYWSADGERIFGKLHYREGAPTHWMPLPEPPK